MPAAKIRERLQAKQVRGPVQMCSQIWPNVKASRGQNRRELDDQIVEKSQFSQDCSLQGFRGVVNRYQARPFKTLSQNDSARKESFQPKSWMPLCRQPLPHGPPVGVALRDTRLTPWTTPPGLKTPGKLPRAPCASPREEKLSANARRMTRRKMLVSAPGRAWAPLCLANAGHLFGSGGT